MAGPGGLRGVFDQQAGVLVRGVADLQAKSQIPLSTLRSRHHVDIRTRLGECEPTLETLRDETDAWGHPMLVVLDTFGGAVSARLLHRIAANIASEVIVTIQPQHFSRFAEAEGVTNGDEVFGNETWRLAAQQSSSEKARWLLEHYRQTVHEAGFAHVLDFELIDDRGQSLYLVLGTSHERGLQKMKEVLWEVDDAAGVGYRDPRDPAQQTLAFEIKPQTAPLRRLMRDYLASRPNHRATVHACRRFALFYTVYKESQVRPALQRMIDDDVLLCENQSLAHLELSSVVRLR